LKTITWCPPGNNGAGTAKQDRSKETYKRGLRLGEHGKRKKKKPAKTDSRSKFTDSKRDTTRVPV